MRVLVIGDSHAACLLEAWREGGWDAGAEVAFFARHAGRSFAHVVEGDRIRAGSEEFARFLARMGQAAEHDLAAQDAVVIVGCGISLFPLAQVVNVYRVLGWPEAAGTEEMPALTERVLRVAFAEALAATPAMRLLQELRACPALAERVVHLVPQPLPAVQVMAGGAAGAGVRRAVRRGFGPALRAVFEEEVARFAAERGLRVHPQPEATVVRGCLTAEGYTKGARRLVNLALPQPATDILHANRAYGRLMLAQILV